MEKAILDGQIIYASDVKENYEYEKYIRECSSKGRLKCPDKNCSLPTLRYCHGNKKEPYFAHRDASSCDYDKYDRENSATINHIKCLLYTLLSSQNIKVDSDVKVFAHHYAHLVVYTENKKYAFEILKDSTTARKIDKIAKEYENNDIVFTLIVIGEDYDLKRESNANHIRRFSLNESVNNELIVINESGTKVYQYKLDLFNYDYCGNNIFEYDAIYSEKQKIENLTFEKERLSIGGFLSRYIKWYEVKQHKYKMFLDPKPLEKPMSKEKKKTIDVVKEIIKPPFIVDVATPINISDLCFIENITPPNKRIKLVEWNESVFLKKLEKICYERDEVVFKNLILKFMTANKREQELINKLWKKYKIERNDYFYILKTAREKSSE